MKLILIGLALQGIALAIAAKIAEIWWSDISDEKTLIYFNLLILNNFKSWMCFYQKKMIILYVATYLWNDEIISLQSFDRIACRKEI